MVTTLETPLKKLEMKLRDVVEFASLLQVSDKQSKEMSVILGWQEICNMKSINISAIYAQIWMKFFPDA